MFVKVVALLLLIVSAKVALTQEGRYFLNEEDDCKAVQALQPGRDYYYTYEGTVDHKSSTDHPDSGFKIRCNRVVISVLASCAARMKMEGCAVSHAQERNSNGTLLFREGSSTLLQKFAHQFQRFYTYFYFNGGEVTKLFFHENEGNEVGNIKKAILFALSLKFTGQGYQETTTDSIQISGHSIYGPGYATATISRLTLSKLRITTTRLYSEHPMSRNLENSRLRFPRINSDSDENSFSLFVTKQLQLLFYKNFGNSNPVQTCHYTIKRKRKVEEIICSETHSIPMIVNNYNGTDNAQHALLVPMFVAGQHKIFKAQYNEESLSLQSQLNANFEDSLSNFDAHSAFMRLVKEPIVETAPIFSKLTFWMLGKDDSVLNGLWSRIASSVNADRSVHIAQAGKIWAELLSNCVRPEWCNSKTDCSNSDGCQNTLASYVTSGDVSNMEKQTLHSIVEVFSSIKYPTTDLFQAAMDLARENSSPAAVRGLGRVLTRFTAKNKLSSNPIVIQGLEVLQEIIENGCPRTHGNKNQEEIVVSAINAASSFLQHNDGLMRAILTCIDLPNTPGSVLVAGVQFLNNNVCLSMPQVRPKLMNLILNERLGSQVRLPSVLVILMNQPTSEELTNILRLVNPSNEETQLRSFIRAYISSQIQLAGTKYQSLDNDTINEILTLIQDAGVRNQFPKAGENIKKTTFERDVPVYLPILGQTFTLTVQRTFYYYGENLAPFLIDLAALTEIKGEKITLFEFTIDMGKVTAILKPLFAPNGYFSLKTLNHILSMPLYEWPEPLTINTPRMSTDSLNNLMLIKDQFKMAEILSRIERKPIVDIKVFGRTFSADELISPISQDNPSIAEMFAIFQKIEQGIDIDFSTMNAMGHFQSQVPTSIGLSLSTNVEITNFLRYKLRFQAPLTQLFYTGHGNVVFDLNLGNQLYVNLERIMKPPLGDLTGTATLFQFGYDQQFSVTLKKSARKLVIIPNQRSEQTEFQSYKTFILATPGLNATGISTISKATRCSKRTLFRTAFEFNILYKATCGNEIAPHKRFVDIESFPEELKFIFTWGPKVVEHEGEYVPSRNFKATIHYNDRNRPASASMHVRHFPTLHTVKYEFATGGIVYARAASNFVLDLDEANSVFNGLFMSFNVTSWLFSNPLMTAVFSLQRCHDNVDIQTELTLLGLSNHFRHGSGPGYDLKGKFVFPKWEINFDFVGLVPLPTSEGKLTALAKIYSPKKPKDPFAIFVYDKDIIVEDGKQIPQIEISLKDMKSRPRSVNSMKLYMTWFNETNIGYQKTLRFETWFREGVPGPFFDLRQATVFDASRGPQYYDWNSTVTFPKFQGQWRADARDPEKFTILSRIVVPKRKINLTEILPRSYEQIKLSTERPDVKVYGVDVVSGTQPEGHINATVFVQASQFKSYVHVSKIQDDCPFCLLVDVNILRCLNGHFAFKIKSNSLHSSFSMTLPSQAAQDKKLLQKFLTYDGNQVTLAYNFNLNATMSNINVNGLAKLGSYQCDLSGLVGWDLENNLRNNFYNSDLTLFCGKQVAADQRISDLNVQVDFKYRTTTGESAKSRDIYFYQSASKENLVGVADQIFLTLTSQNDRLQELSVSRNSRYNFSQSEFNDAISDKVAILNLSLSQQNLEEPLWTFPAYNLTVKALAPVLKNIPGGERFTSEHSGLYFFEDPGQNTFDNVCGTDVGCKEKYQSLMQMNVEESKNAVKRFSNYAKNEFESFLSFPVKHLHKVMTSSSYSEMNPFDFNVLDVIKFLKKYERNMRENQDFTSDEPMTQSILRKFSQERNLFKMQNYLMILTEKSWIENPRFNITQSKIYIESFFKDIYGMDYTLCSILSNPLTLTTQTVRFRNYLELPQFENQKTYKTFGISYPGMTQFITMNDHYHVIPCFPNENCSWLGTVDILDGIVTVTFKESGLELNFMDETLWQLRNGSFQFTDGNGDSSVLEYPFATKKCFCRKLSDMDVECYNFFSYMRFTFDINANEVLYYVETQDYDDLSAQLKGMNGIATKGEVPNRLLPNGRPAADEAEFLNSYELSGNEQCHFLNQDFVNLHLTRTGPHVCNDAFSAVSSPPSFSGERQALLQACYDKATSRRDTCKYTSLFVESLRRSHRQAASDPSCLTCGVEETSVEINNFNILLVISRSEDLEENPTKRKLINLITRSLQRFQADGISDVSISILTYGGPLQFYQPAINTIHNSVSSSNVADIQRVISKLRFNGPPYAPRSTVDVLGYVAKDMSTAYKGIARSVVVVAPETSDKNIGGQLPTALAQKYSNSLTNVYLFATMDNSQCNSHLIPLPSQTNGGCFPISDLSGIVQSIQTSSRAKINQSASCTCTEEPETGEIASRCVLSSSNVNN